MKMEQQAGEQSEFSDVVETLTNMFGNVLSKDVIMAVVESCEGDLNLAAEAIMSMSDEVNVTSTPTEETSETIHNNTPEPLVYQCEEPQNTPAFASPSFHSATAPFIAQPTLSYASVSQSSPSTGAVPKQTPKPRTLPAKAMVWTDQLRQIVTYHNQGTRTLIIMRGLSGSGKTYLAKQIIEILIGGAYIDYKTHIFSTDDYFMIRGQYQHQKYKLSEAHEWNQNRAKQALRQGLSPVIIDNTNVEIWEMEPYVREGVKNGYIIEVVEPNTPWAKKVSQLMKRNTHNVPLATIKRKLESYQDGVTGQYLIRFWGLLYPADMVPPVYRKIPHYNPPRLVSSIQNLTIAQSDTVDAHCNCNITAEQIENVQTGHEENPNVVEAQIPDSTQPQENRISNLTERIIPIEVESEEEELARQRRYAEIQKQLEEIEKVEQEWENGEGWEDNSQEKDNDGGDTVNDASTPLEPRPRRRTDFEEPSTSQSTSTDTLLKTVHACKDWRQISMFMPSWAGAALPSDDEIIELPVRETKTTGTCMEVGDTDIQSPRKISKVMTATPRDINLLHIPTEREKIPKVRMLDKSSMTNEMLITEAYRCKNEEQHFMAFRKLFKNIPRASLRDIFDKCCGDVNWAVDIVLGGMAENQLEIMDGDDVSDTEEETMVKSEQCNCLAAYQIVPDAEPNPTTSTANYITANQQNIPSVSTEFNILPQKKTKVVPSDSSLQLKRQIEKNVVISDDHYSQHTLKIRKWRRGESSDNSAIQTLEDTIDKYLESEPQPSTSRDDLEDVNQQLKDDAASQSDDEESNTSSMDDIERTVNINVGFEFIRQLDELFGRRAMTYPESIVPRINIPISLLNEINAFWMESLMCQFDDQDKQEAKMLKEDAEFARQLALKEQELAQQGKEPEVPDFKEIMDMDFALSLYQKDVAEWKSKEPMDMAAKLSRDKLYNLFPDMNPDILSELLMAHDNNFQCTVEVLLMSTGKANILEEINGLNKFVMQKEMERQEKLLEEEKKALSEVEWPLLPKGEKVDLTVVNNYREEANQHLLRRNMNYTKAQDYIRRGMTQVANYYSDIASYHKKKYEQANSLAAASLMQVHASNCPDNATIDLHYLRVGEAKESLDLFLDTHIQKLKESGNKNVKYHTLFFITGRGLHSNGKPRVKPAVKKRLRERGLTFSERNPGLLTTKVSADDKLSYQVQVP